MNSTGHWLVAGTPASCAGAMRRLPRLRRTGLTTALAWGLVWLICFQNAMVAIASSAVVRTPDGRIVVLCTSLGLQSVRIGDGPRDERESPAPAGALCPTMLLAGALSMAVPVHAVLLTTPALSADRHSDSRSVSPPRVPRRAADPIRAPPITA